MLYAARNVEKKILWRFKMLKKIKTVLSSRYEVTVLT